MPFLACLWVKSAGMSSTSDNDNTKTSDDVRRLPGVVAAVAADVNAHILRVAMTSRGITRCWARHVDGLWFHAQEKRIPAANRVRKSPGVPRIQRARDEKYQKNIEKRGNVTLTSKVR